MFAELLCTLDRTLNKSTSKKNIFLISHQKVFCRYSKEPFQPDVSFEHPKDLFKIMGKKYLQFFAENFCLSKPVVAKCLTVCNVIQKKILLFS